MNITYTEKDKVLTYLCTHTGDFSLSAFTQETNIDALTLRSILEYFRRIGIIEKHFFIQSNTVTVTPLIEAFDIFNRGGFTLQENILQKEIEKLQLEIERLRPALGEKVEQISNITANIVSVLGTIFRW